MALRWFVIRTESRAEYLSAKHLTDDGFEVFFPRIKTSLPRFGHTDKPLFPGYLFLRLDPEATGWPTFRLLHRVSHWVKFGDHVPSVSDESIASLAQHVENPTFDNGLWKRYRTGDTVQVNSEFINSVATVVEEAKSPLTQAKVLIEFMGRLVQATVPWENLRPFETQPLARHESSRRTRGKGRRIREVNTEVVLDTRSG